MAIDIRTDKPDYWIEGIQEAALTAAEKWQDYDRATTPTGTANAIIGLAEAMSDLATYLPGYDADLGWIDWEQFTDE